MADVLKAIYPRIVFNTAPISAEEKVRRRRLNRPALDEVIIASIYPPDGSEHHGEGDTPAHALMRAVAHWEAREFPR